MSARGYALHSVCPTLSFFVYDDVDELEKFFPLSQAFAFFVRLLFFAMRLYNMTVIDEHATNDFRTLLDEMSVFKHKISGAQITITI